MMVAPCLEVMPMCAHDKIIDLLDEITSEKDAEKLPVLVEQLHRLVADEIASLTVLIASGVGS